MERKFENDPTSHKLLKGLPVDRRVRVDAGDCYAHSASTGGTEPRAAAFMSIFMKTVSVRPRGPWL